jgi:hypothetical protein
VAGGGDAGGAVDVDAHVSLLGEQRLARVQPHADSDRARAQRLLPRRRGRDRVAGTGEGEEERISLRVDLRGVEAADDVAEHASMVGYCVRISVFELSQQSRRAFDVREEEGDGPGVELARLIMREACGCSKCEVQPRSIMRPQRASMRRVFQSTTENAQVAMNRPTTT